MITMCDSIGVSSWKQDPRFSIFHLPGKGLDGRADREKYMSLVCNVEVAQSVSQSLVANGPFPVYLLYLYISSMQYLSIVHTYSPLGAVAYHMQRSLGSWAGRWLWFKSEAGFNGTIMKYARNTIRTILSILIIQLDLPRYFRLGTWVTSDLFWRLHRSLDRQRLGHVICFAHACLSMDLFMVLLTLVKSRIKERRTILS